MRRQRALAKVLAGLAVVALTGGACTKAAGDGTVAVAEARVAANEAALSAAKAEATAASAAFCAASKSYVTALDRYGDILNATAPTVGDVKSGGQELAAPGRVPSTAPKPR